MAAEHFQVIIVGAGPVGLSLALGLGQAGAHVLVLEKDQELQRHSRAPAIWPRTQEILNGLGVLAECVRQGILHSDLRLTDADSDSEKSLVHLPLRELQGETPFPRLLILPQEKTEKILWEKIHTTLPNVQVLFGCEFLGFNENEAGVQVSYRRAGEMCQATGVFLTGCDGAHSAVRECLGFHLSGKTYGIRASLADIRLADVQTSYASPRVSTQGGVAIGIQIEKDLWRIILPYADTDDLPLDERLRRVVQPLFSQGDYTVVWKSEFKLHDRVSDAFQKGRVVLAGDAAHLNSPVGGQGMNAGIQDTEKLKQALLADLAEGGLQHVTSYARDRRASIKGGVNTFTDLLTKTLLFNNGKAIRPVLRGANLALKIPPFRKAFLHRVAMLGLGGIG